MEQPLSETLSAEFRSLVGIAMYVSHERFDLQFATKSLATFLKSPTKRAWVDLGSLVGYMKFSTPTHPLTVVVLLVRRLDWLLPPTLQP